MNYDEYRRRDLRLVMLRSLSKQPGYSANSSVLAMEAEAFGHAVSRDTVNTELRKLAELGAVTLKEAGSVLVAVLALRGLEHVQGKTVLDAVNQPSPEG